MTKLFSQFCFLELTTTTELLCEIREYDVRRFKTTQT